MKVVVNRCHGGYGLSEKAYEALGLKWDGFGYAFAGDRSNPELVRVVESLGDEASGDYASLAVVNIPDGIHWHLEHYDGIEHVAENHRTWC